MKLKEMYRNFRDNKLFRNIAIYGASNAISALSPFLLLPVLTAYLTPTEFGSFSIFVLLVGVFSILIGVNVNGSISVNYFKFSSGVFRKFVTSCFALVSFVFLLTLLFYQLVFSQVASFLKVDDEIVVFAVVVGFFNVFYISCLAILQSSDNALTFLKLKMTQSFGDILFSLVLIVGVSYGLYGRISAFSVAIITCSIMSIYLLTKKNFLGGGISKQHIKKALVFGLPLLPHTLSGSAIMFTDRVVISNIIDTNATGIYMAGMQVAMAMMLIIEPVNKAYTPWLFRKLSGKTFDDSKHKIIKMSYIYFCFLIVAALVLYGLNDVVFYILVDKKFHAAKDCMLFLLLGFAFQGMYYAVTNYMFYSERTGVLSIITVISAVSGVVLSYILVTDYGILGASIAFMLSNCLLFILVWGVSMRYIDMPWFSIKIGRQGTK